MGITLIIVIKNAFFSTHKLIFWHNLKLKLVMKFKILILSLITLIYLSGCQTIKKKSDEVAERENQKFGQFVGKQIMELKKELGEPTDDFINDLGNETIVYKTKKYGIPCERRFIINTNGTIIGFSSSGCI